MKKSPQPNCLQQNRGNHRQIELIEKYQEIILYQMNQIRTVSLPAYEFFRSSGYRNVYSTREAQITAPKQAQCVTFILKLAQWKIVIQQDNTEDIAPELERYKVPKEHIVLGCRAHDMRQYIGYAVE